MMIPITREHGTKLHMLKTQNKRYTYIKFMNEGKIYRLLPVYCELIELKLSSLSRLIFLVSEKKWTKKEKRKIQIKIISKFF